MFQICICIHFKYYEAKKIAEEAEAERIAEEAEAKRIAEEAEAKMIFLYSII